MVIVEKYVNNYIVKKCKYYIILNLLYFVMCCRYFIFCFRIWFFFLWMLFFCFVLYKGFDDVNYIVYCKKNKIEIYVYSLWLLWNLLLKLIRLNGKLLKYDKKCIIFLGCIGLGKIVY